MKSTSTTQEKQNKNALTQQHNNINPTKKQPQQKTTSTQPAFKTEMVI